MTREAVIALARTWAAIREAEGVLVCPCERLDVEDPGPEHIDSCPWRDPNYQKECPF